MAKKSIILFFCFIFLISFASALDFDNVKPYNETTKTYEVINWFGLGETLAEIKLISPLNVQVGQGYNKVAEFALYNYKADYKDAFSKIDFYEAKDLSKSLERTFDYKYKTLITEEKPIYENICTPIIMEKELDTKLISNITTTCKNELIGYKNITKDVWIKFNDVTDLPKDKNMFIIGIFTNVKKGDNVEWIPTFFGEELKKWATWTESLNADLVNYYKFDDNNLSDSIGNSDGIDIETTNTIGLIEDARNWTTTLEAQVYTESLDYTGDHSISLWVKSELDGPSASWMSFYTTGDTTKWGFLYNYGSDYIRAYPVSGGDWDVDLQTGDWIHIVATQTQAGTVTLYIDNTILGSIANVNTLGTNQTIGGMNIGGNPIYGWAGKIDEVGVWDRVLTTGEIEQLYNEGNGISYTNIFGVAPSITLVSPADTANLTNPSVTFQTTVTDSQYVQNVSLYLDGIINETKTTHVNGSYSFSKTVTEGEHNWSTLAFNNQTISNQSSTWTFTYTRPPILVTLVSPVDTANLTSSSVDFISTVTDFSQVENVSLYLDGILNETSTTGFNGTYTFSKVIAEGEHNWSILAYNDGDHLNQSETRTLNYTQPPIYIDLLSPTDASTFESPTVNVSCNAYKAEGVTQLNLTINGIVNKTVVNTTTGQNLSIDGNLNFAEGNYNWSCSALNLNTSATSTNRTFTVDYADTIFTLFTPINDTTINNYSIDFAFNASNVNEIYNFTLYIDDAVSETLTDFSATGNYTINKLLYEGNYTWFIQAFSKVGTITNSTKRTLEVLYPTPNITLLSPANDSTFLVSEVTFIINVSNIFGIGNVTLYLDGVINETNVSILNGNYTFVKNLSSGFHTWKAVVYSALGKINISETRNISVHTIAPTVSVTAPTGLQDFIILGQNETLNYNISELGENLTTHLDSCWYDYPKTEKNISDSDFISATYWNIANGTMTSSVGENVLRKSTLLPSSITTLTTVYATNAMIISDFYEGIPDCINVGYGNYGAYSHSDYGHYACVRNDNKRYYLIKYNSDGTFTSYNYTTDINCSETSINFTYVAGKNNLTVYAKDEYGLIGSNTTTWSYIFESINITYDSEIYEGSLDEFTLTTTVDPAYAITESIFEYNNTNYTTSVIFSGGTYSISSSISAPGVEADTNFSLRFYIKVGEVYFSPVEYTQLVLNADFGACGVGDDLLLNISLVDEETRADLLGNIELTAELLGKLDNQTVSSTNITFTNVTYGEVCLTPTLAWDNYYLDVIIRYEADNYSAEFYNIQSVDLSTYPKDLTLFDLASTDTTEFLIKYQDDSLIPVSDAVVQLLRFYVGSGISEVVEAPTTSDIGTAIVHIDLNTYGYSAIIVKNGEVLDVFDNLVFNCENELAGQCTENLLGNINPQNIISSETLNDFTYTIIEVNETITVTYIIPSGSPDTINIFMKQTDTFGEEYLCNQTIVSSAGSIDCSYNATIGDSVVELFVKRGDVLEASKSYIVPEANGVDWLDNNFFIVFILALSVIAMAFSSPEFIVINAVIVLLLAGSLWLLNGLNFVMGLGSLIWLVIAAGILIDKLAKQEDR